LQNALYFAGMKVLLTTLNSKYIHSNLAIRILYQLNKAYTGLAWKEFVIKEEAESIAEYCAQYDVVAFSCYIWNITQTLAVARAIKKINPLTQILLGGPEVSYDWQEVIDRQEVDYIIVGEGEIPFAEFLQYYPQQLEKVSCLVRKQVGVVQYNPLAKNFEVSALADIMPYADDEPETLQNKVLYIETSRGCPYKCEFCLASLDNKVRYLPDAAIKSTLLYMMQHGRVIKFLDRTFNIKKDFTIDIFRFILQHHRPGNVFQFEITADIVHPDIIAFIQAEVPPGLFRFEIGIQTVNQKANLEVSRKQNFEKTSGIIRQLDNKIEMHLDLIVGLPLDYFEDIRYSFEQVFLLFAPELQLGFLKFLKGTPVRDKYEQHGYVFDPEPPYQIIESHYLSKEQLASIVVLENALEIYWNRKRALHTLRYITKKYSVFDFLMQLGFYFEARSAFHQHSLVDIFSHLYHFALEQYPQDKVLHELITVDYYLYTKIRPQDLFGKEAHKRDMHQWLNQLQWHHLPYRFVALPISFLWKAFLETEEIVPATDRLWIRYDGKSKSVWLQEHEHTTITMLNVQS
jgi:anaerobic magnesium-protoporphyrin IX monomethyl ester cyclase